MTITEGTYGIGHGKNSAFFITCDAGCGARLVIPRFLKHGADADVAWEYHGALCGWELLFYDETGVRDPGHRCRMCSRPRSNRLLKSRR